MGLNRFVNLSFLPCTLGGSQGCAAQGSDVKCESALQNWEEPHTRRLWLLPVRPLFPTGAGCEPETWAVGPTGGRSPAR